MCCAWNRSQVPIQVVEIDLRPWKSMWYLTRLTHAFFHTYYSGGLIQQLISAFPSGVKDKYVFIKLEFFNNQTFKLYGKSSLEGDYEAIKDLGEILLNNPAIVDILIKLIMEKKASLDSLLKHSKHGFECFNIFKNRIESQ